MPAKRVRKRDGREEGFDPLRLADSLRLALEAAELHYDLAEPLADAIHASFEVDRPVDSVAIAEAAEAALGQCGAGAAEAYRGARRIAQSRAVRLRVHSEKNGSPKFSVFDRERLALSLVRERYLERNTAARVARQVQHRLVDGDHHHVTSALIRALADNECRALGLRGSSMRVEDNAAHRELMTWLGGDVAPGPEGEGPVLGGEGADLRPLLGERVLSSFALGEILTEEQGLSLESGGFDLPGLGDWTRPARIRLFPLAGEAEEDFWGRVENRLPQCREVQVHWPGSREVANPEAVAHLLKRDAIRLSTSHSELALAWASEGIWVRVPARSFLQFDKKLREDLVATQRVLLTWKPSRPGSASGETLGEEVLASFAVLNFSDLARRAGPGGEASFMEECAAVAELACRSIAALLRRSGHRSSSRVTLLPAGLGEAAGVLAPASMVRFLLGLGQLMNQSCFAAELKPVFDSPPHPRGAGRRLAQAVGRDDALSVGWHLADEIPLGDVFATFPWVEFPASVSLESAAWAARLNTTTAV